MGEIKEFIPVALGFVLGIASIRIPVPRVRYIVLGVLAVVIGVIWSMTVGEFDESPAFALVDIATTAIGMAIGYGVATYAGRRMAQTR
jgi:flagellar biosynthesis protein FliR